MANEKLGTGSSAISLEHPERETIKRGSRFLYSAKIGGERRYINVMAKTEAYEKDFGKGRKAWYVDIFGYGFSGSVLASTLIVVPKQDNLLDAI